MTISAKKATISILASTLMLGVFLIVFFPAPEHPQAHKLPSSYMALNDWGITRTVGVEGEKTPGYFQAWQRKQALQGRKGALKVTDPWTSLGPANFAGRVLSLAVDPEDPNLVYAGSASGGLWRSRNVSIFKWERVAIDYPVLGVGAIEIRPDDRNRIYIGTGEVYRYQSAFPGYGSRLTRGSYGLGILMSDDGGETWEMALDWRYNQERGVQDIAMNPQDYDQVWAATTEGVYRSDDGGTTWSRKLDVVMATSLVINRQNPQIVLAACGGFFSEGHGIYRSEDGGESWTKLTENIPETFGGKAILDASPSDPDIVYASIGNGFNFHEIINDPETSITWLLRSNDGGAHFELVNTQDYASYQGWYSHFVKVLPNDPQQLIVGGVRLYSSTDGGANLTNNLLLGADYHQAASAPSDPQVMYLAYDQGVRVSRDGGQFFQFANNGLTLAQFYRGNWQSSTTPDLIITAPQDTSEHRYTGSQQWDTGIAPEASYFAVDPENNQTLYFTDLDGRVVRIGRVGSTTNPLYEGDVPLDVEQRTNFNAPVVLAPSNPAVLYVGFDLVFRTANYGETWTATNGGQTLDGNPVLSLAVSHQDENLVYAATAPRFGPMHFYRSRDGGTNWTDLSQGLPNRFPTAITVDPEDDSRVYVTFSGFGSSHVFASGDQGDTWLDIDRGFLPDVPTSALAVDPDFTDHLYVANDVGVFVSLDRGQSWFAFAEGLPTAVIGMDLLIYQPDRLLRLATHGNGMYQRKLLEPQEALEDQVTLLYPWISNRDGDFRSVLIANNLGDAPVVATLTALRADGATETVTRHIEAKGFLAESAATLFPNLGSGPGYSVRLRTAEPWVRGRWVTQSLQATSGASPSQGVAVLIPKDGEAPEERVGHEIVFGYLPAGDNFLSAPVIVNAGNETTDVSLEFFDREGSSLGTHELVDLKPGAPFAQVLGQIIQEDVQDVYMVARSSTTPISGVSFIFDTVFFENAIGNATAIDGASDPASSKTLLYPWISNQTDFFQSTVVAVNYGEQPVNITLTARRESGEMEVVQREIAAGGFLAESSADLFPGLGSGGGYSVTLASPRDTVTGQWVTTNLKADSGASPAQGVAVTIGNGSAKSRRQGQQLLFGYLPITGNATSAPVLVNTGTENAAVTLYFYDTDGQLLLQDQTTLADMPPLRPFARLVNDLLPDAGSDVVMVAVSQTQPLTGVAFVFDSQFFEPAIGNASAVTFDP